MSALILLALAVASFVAFAAQRDARNAVVRDVAEGMTKASAIFLFTMLAACVGVFVFSVSMDTDVAAMKLRDIESGLRFAQAWRARILGPWDWRLVLGYVGIALAGILFALEDAASRVMWGLRHIKIAGAVLALLASLTITTLPAEEALQDLELRYAEATDNMASDAQVIENLAAAQVRQTAVDVVVESVLYCSDDVGPSCPQLKSMPGVPPHLLIADDPRLSSIWEGTYVWADPPSDDAVADKKLKSVARPFAEWREALAETTPGELAARRWMVGRLVGAQTRAYENARDALLGLAVDAGYETAVEAARHAGASGDIVEALLMPLVAAPVKALIERLTQDAMSRALSGKSTAADIDRLVRAGIGPAVKTGEPADAVNRAIAASASALAEAEATSGQVLVELRQQEEREAAARANASTGAPPTFGTGVVSIPYGSTTGTGSPAPYGGPPVTGRTGGRTVVVP